ncbi:MAG: GNAT family N-acetyltransferase [Cyanobacteria bacterium P01_A01_bin.84]
MNIVLETERIILRQFIEDDVDKLVELNSDPDVVKFTSDAEHPQTYLETKAKVAKIINSYQKYNGYGIWAAIEKSSQSFIGWFLFRPVIDASYFDPNFADEDDIELGYRLKKIFWGQGYGTEVSQALINQGFSELGMKRVLAVAISANKASIRVMEKVGLQLEHKFIYQENGQEVVIYALNKCS